MIIELKVSYILDCYVYALSCRIVARCVAFIQLAAYVICPLLSSCLFKYIEICDAVEESIKQI